MANFGDMTITVKADESFTRVVELTPVMKRLIELLELHDPERGLTKRAPDPDAQDALMQDVMEIINQWIKDDDENPCALERALRKRLFRQRSCRKIGYNRHKGEL